MSRVGNNALDFRSSSFNTAIRLHNCGASLPQGNSFSTVGYFSTVEWSILTTTFVVESSSLLLWNIFTTTLVFETSLLLWSIFTTTFVSEKKLLWSVFITTFVFETFYHCGASLPLRLYLKHLYHCGKYLPLRLYLKHLYYCGAYLPLLWYMKQCIRVGQLYHCGESLPLRLHLEPHYHCGATVEHYYHYACIWNTLPLSSITITTLAFGTLYHRGASLPLRLYRSVFTTAEHLYCS